MSFYEDRAIELLTYRDRQDGDERAAIVYALLADRRRIGSTGGTTMSASVYAQETIDGKWIWWISAANHASVARSCRAYTTERAAITAAKAVAALGEIAVDERNLR